MKRNFELMVLCCAALLVGVTGCSKSGGDKKVVADADQDTMLLHDLAEANRNTATAETDTTMAVVQRNGAGPGALTSGTVDAGSRQSATPAPAPVPRPVSKIPAPTRANDASAPITVPTTRTTTTNRTPAPSPAGDPCDSPAMSDQRSCLNRYIAGNDADLNRVYQDLVHQARASGGPDLEERFRQTQRNWVERRDVECRQQNSIADGRLWARGMARCLGNHSDRRVLELQRSLNQLRGQ
ncbi:MAG TPA: lysozyme inhibitor LprI family protein [Gemmatimonadaceae bacterium]|nr:lysozyme inhibitor LprI family protein [Gemmatimonadaceae bacterium]